MVAGRRSRAGFSMLEAVIVLAIMSFVAALVMTRASVALDQIAVHNAFQDFQTSLVRLRADAFARAEPIGVRTEDLHLPRGWSVHSAVPLTIGADGDCTGAEVELLRGDKVRARLAPTGRECRYLRLS